jgi:hypothetical protein
MFFCAFRIRFFGFHNSSPHFKFTMKLKYCQIDSQIPI